MRLSVDGAALTDPRIRRLGKALGMTWFEAIGRLLSVWLLCYERRCAVVDVDDVDVVTERDGFAAAMVATKLAEQRPGGEVRVRGVEDRIEFLKRQVQKGKASAKARAAKVAGSTASQHRFTGGSEAAATYSSSSALDQPPVQDPAPPSPCAATTPVRASKGPRGSETPLRVDWEPDATACAVAAQVGLDVVQEVAGFRDHALAHDRRVVDWQAAFRSWLRKGAELRRSRQPAASGRTGRLEPHAPDVYGETREVAL